MSTPPDFPVFGSPWHFGERSRRELATVHPELQAVIVRALELSPWDFAVLSGTRTTAEQIEKVEQGHSRCDPREGCVSAHLQGRAVDIAPIVDGEVELWNRTPYREMAPYVKLAAEQLGIPVEWLGDKPIDDVAHWALPKGHPQASTEGYRRARQAEVTPEIEARAKAALSHDLGTILGPFVDRETGSLYRVALEVHSNAPKGASVFLRDSTGVVA